VIHLEPPTHGPFRIVVVSRADVSRGPAVQYILRAHLRMAESDADIVISSAGTVARPGQALDPVTADALHDLGDTEGGEQLGSHVAHRVSERRLAQADLVLAVGRDERRRAVELRPDVRARAFTVVEFARLLTALPEAAEDPHRLVRQAATLRAAVRPVDASEDDLEDVAGAGLREHEWVVRRIDHAATDISRGLSRTLEGAEAHWA
jgi:protein-tyrosine phosphatase